MVICRSTGQLATAAGASILGWFNASATLSEDITECAGNPNPIVGGHRKWHEVTIDVTDTIYDTVACVLKEQITVGMEFDVTKVKFKLPIMIPKPWPWKGWITAPEWMWPTIKYTKGELSDVKCKPKNYEGQD
ncbi:MAG: hypothetical protein F4227_00905 [Gammaproteobacteria bacterium]|nr:hypothetical protein [Gammaproteobacteria bacterium]MYF01569.1 hypothetical protein [Gammaproteobacteria bacterium]MYI77201.1 hypothetical protein [Gammaproteobacteria bacterium]